MRLTDDQLRDVLAPANEMQRQSMSGSAAGAERDAVIHAGEAIGLQGAGGAAAGALATWLLLVR